MISQYSVFKLFIWQQIRKEHLSLNHLENTKQKSKITDRETSRIIIFSPFPFPALLIAPASFHAAWNQTVHIPSEGINHFSPEEERGFLKYR